MPIWLLPLLLALSALVTMTSGIWLLLHLTALARRFAGNADVVPSPARPKAPRWAVRVALAGFVGGTATTLAVLLLAITLPVG